MQFWICVLCCLSIIIGTTYGICDFNLEPALYSKTPVTIINGSILNPHNRNGDVTIYSNDAIQLLCPGKNNQIMTGRNGQLLNARCILNHFLLDSDDNKYNFHDLQCKRNPQGFARQVGTCNMQSKRIQIGFQVTPSQFLSLIEVCFDPSRLITYWSFHVLKTTEYFCRHSESTVFKRDFFNASTNSQISSYPDFERGHLSPKCDFFTGPEKRMTFQLVNTAVQNKKFNRLNWRDLEEAIRSAANHGAKIVNIYTGTAHTVQYLGNSVPVQLYFWKAVIGPASGDGVAFIGINTVTQEVACPCEEVQCNQLHWLSAKLVESMSDFSKGRIYCCTIQSLQNIPGVQLPHFEQFSGGLLANL